MYYTSFTMKSLWKSALLAAILASVANIALLFIGKSFVSVPDTFKPLSVPPVILWSVLGTIGATLTYLVIRRVATNADRVFLGVAGVMLVLSFIPDYMLKGIPAGTMFGGASMGAIYLLMSMHVVAASIIVWLLLRSPVPTNS